MVWDRFGINFENEAIRNKTFIYASLLKYLFCEFFFLATFCSIFVLKILVSQTDEQYQKYYFVVAQYYSLLAIDSFWESSMSLSVSKRTWGSMMVDKFLLKSLNWR